MINKQILLPLVSAFILFGYIIYSSFEIISEEVIPSSKFIYFIVFFGVNIYLYIKNLNKGIVFSFFILILATFGILSYEINMVVKCYFIEINDVKISTPDIHFTSLFILIIHYYLNKTLLNNYLSKLLIVE